MKKIFFKSLYLLLISLFSCQEDSSFLSKEMNDDLSLVTSATTRGDAGDGEYDILGHGYDITSLYLDTKAAGAIVFDMDKLEKNLSLDMYQEKMFMNLRLICLHL